jgi:hypothetical protein
LFIVQDIKKKVEHDVSEAGSIFVHRRRREDDYYAGSLRKS